MKTTTLTLAALGAAMLSAASVPALAGDAQGASLSYGDLDLGTAAGRATLASRYDQAAREKCGIADGQKADFKARNCYKNTGAQYRQFAAAILAQHDKAAQEKTYGLAVR